MIHNISEFKVALTPNRSNDLFLFIIESINCNATKMLIQHTYDNIFTLDTNLQSNKF